MKKRVLISAVLAGVLMFTGCGNSNDGTGGNNIGGTGGDTDGTIKILTDTGTVSIDPTEGGTVIIRRNGNNNTNTVATVVHSELNECTDVTTLGSRVACGPKPGITYIFQSDFGALGPIDDLASTPDGGALLFDALTEYNGTKVNTPVEGNPSENRIQEVFIPTNYIMLDDMAKDDSVGEKYEYMREYLADMANIKHLVAEPDNNPYFNGVTDGNFVATYVMHFTRGVGESTLMEQFKTDTTNLEYLSVSFKLNVAQVDGNSSKLRFSSPAGSDVVFGAKKAGQVNGVQVNTTNIALNSILHESPNDSDNAITINMAKYFDKVIAKGKALGIEDFAKEILVTNASNPWPVKIYGTLHEINDDGTFQRSFVRNPGELNASLFGLDLASNPYSGAYALTNGNTNQAYKFNIVYPGGKYNKLD